MDHKSKIKSIFKVIGVAGIFALCTYGIKGILFFDKTNTRNKEVPEIKQMLLDFKSDVNIKITEIKTTINDFILQHKEEEQIRTQETINFQEQQIKILKDNRR